MNYYEILGVPRDALTNEVADAFRYLLFDRLARGRNASELYAAWAVLSDPVLRDHYDSALASENAPGMGFGRRLGVGDAALFLRDLVAGIDPEEMASRALRLGLKAAVTACSAAATIASATTDASRRIQGAAEARLQSVPEEAAATSD